MSRYTVGGCVLAAGKGTRMHSPQPKVLLPLLDEPMLGYLYQALDAVLPGCLTVVGHGADAVRAAFPQRPEASFILQEQQLGTGHALQCAWPALQAAGWSHVLVINGDTPLIAGATLELFMATALQADADLAFLSAEPESPGSFGRVLRDAQGQVRGIIEAKDYDPTQHGPEPREINAGTYLLRLAAVEPLLGQLRNHNKSAEFYITDLVGLAVEQGLSVIAHNAGSDPAAITALLGVNSPLELVQAEELLRERIVRAWQERGCCIRQAASVRIGPQVELTPGVQVTGPCELYGPCRVEEGARIESHCVLRRSHIGSGAVIKSFSHLEGAVVGALCQVGPYARLRPGARLEEDARVGNFVEMKQAVLGKGAKAGHLTYLGDAEIGAGSNIGAGTITCNYDGQRKHKTTIGEGAFIGSNSALVAPVTVGAGSLVGAGSVITEDVPPQSLAIARGRQMSRPLRKTGT